MEIPPFLAGTHRLIQRLSHNSTSCSLRHLVANLFFKLELKLYRLPHLPRYLLTETFY